MLPVVEYGDPSAIEDMLTHKAHDRLIAIDCEISSPHEVKT
jgi:hypothetical protein